jgi:hypothetical protein
MVPYRKSYERGKRNAPSIPEQYGKEQIPSMLEIYFQVFDPHQLAKLTVKPNGKKNVQSFRIKTIITLCEWLRVLTLISERELEWKKAWSIRSRPCPAKPVFIMMVPPGASYTGSTRAMRSSTPLSKGTQRCTKS